MTQPSTPNPAFRLPRTPPSLTEALSLGDRLSSEGEPGRVREDSISRDERRAYVQSARGNPEIVRVNAIGERVSNLTAGEPEFRDAGQEDVRNGDHRGRLDTLF